MNFNIPDDMEHRGPHGEGHHDHHRGRGRGGFGPGGPMGFGPDPFGRPPFGPGGFGPEHGPRGRGGRGRRGQVRESILALLQERPLNGYQIMQELAERTEGLWRPSPGAVYPALAQLEDEGLIEAFDNDGQKAYRLTEAGGQAADGIEAPWEAVNARFAGHSPEAMKALWAEFGGLGGAAKELARTGTAEQLTTAADIIADARRRIYGLLAADPGTPNADDLR
ncbi:MAG: PadR family transcriptional regulator [Propionicimonas sp.]|uniref:PadR family transcriptional regulator n=1 Tax=Propionicimonas sp. TaxID=1955623 RepID=UPI002B1F6548|nr:PadR family transcriptional regulator [Propionicimonas sp.]MEA4943106.1 PadR family transcriptional regulator [Propionicimonas sp.]